MRAKAVHGSTSKGVLAASAGAAALALAAAGCGSAGTTPAAGGASATHHAMASHSPATTEPARFGPDCGMVPATGMGSFHGMAMDPVVTAASHNPLLTSFAADVKAAGLVSELNSMHSFTVFAPANSAFSRLPDAEMSMMHSNAELAKILKHHIVSGRVTPAKLASGMPLTTLEGGSLTGAKMGSAYEIGKANVICGNIQTANATVYVINKVLVPMH
jgi:uncharacterized surface protein with fasciclin (FAS1) repeats